MALLLGAQWELQPGRAKAVMLAQAMEESLGVQQEQRTEQEQETALGSGIEKALVLALSRVCETRWQGIINAEFRCELVLANLATLTPTESARTER